jgi:hypothetical protein
MILIYWQVEANKKEPREKLDKYSLVIINNVTNDPYTIHKKWIYMYKVHTNNYVHMLQDDKNYNLVLIHFLSL